MSHFDLASDKVKGQLGLFLMIEIKTPSNNGKLMLLYLIFYLSKTKNSTT